ncbi:hypothetical protein Tco_1000783 [Tanacetum coccineum]
MVDIRKRLPASFKKRLQYILRSNSDVFTWTYADMTGIPRTITVGGKPFNTEHKLNEYKHIKPIMQKKRRLGHDRNEAACKEVDELAKAGILQKVKDQTWVANPVVEKKSDGGWRMIPIEVFPGCLQRLPSNTNGQGRRRENNFLRMRGTYVDDMVIKSISKEDMLKDIQETFNRFRSINMKLNLKKCSFGGVKKSLPFFKALKSCTDKKIIRWTADAEEAFRKMKKFMEILPTLTAPIKGEVLGITRGATQLSKIGKAHISPCPCCKKTSKAIELGEHDIEFKGCDSVKKQIPNNFLIKIPSKVDDKIKTDKVESKKEGPKLENIWKLYTDGASSSDGSGAGLMLINPEGKEYTYALGLNLRPRIMKQSTKHC